MDSASLTDFGWVVEMRIPYAAYAFSNQKNKLGVWTYEEKQRECKKYTWTVLILRLAP
jgi:hypothetical protein